MLLLSSRYFYWLFVIKGLKVSCRWHVSSTRCFSALLRMWMSIHCVRGVCRHQELCRVLWCNHDRVLAANHSQSKSADYLPVFLKSHSEKLCLTCWKSLVRLLPSDSQSINNVMWKPFKSSVGARWLDKYEIYSPPWVSSEISSFCTTAPMRGAWAFSLMISPPFFSCPPFLGFSPLIDKQSRIYFRWSKAWSSLGWIQIPQLFISTQV